MTPRVLVAGIGNVFLGDDGFGVEVANHLLARPSPEGVLVTEYGIRGVHLAFELLEGYDALVMVDAVPMGEPPGTLAVIRPEALEQPGTDDLEAPVPSIDSHSMSPETVLGVLSGLGGHVDEVYVVGCQPATTAAGMALSDAVAGAVEPACALVGEVLGQLREPTSHGRIRDA